MVSTPLKFSWKYFHAALARSTHYVVLLKGGTYIHGKTFAVVLTAMKNVKVYPGISFYAYNT